MHQILKPQNTTFTRIKSCDFGIDHPVEGVEIAWDRERDVIYVINPKGSK